LHVPDFEINFSVLFSLQTLSAENLSMMDSGPSTTTNPTKKKPVVIITIGMAGAGKSTFVQRINSYLHSLKPPSPPYILNLDPAVTHMPFDANIDIRDTVNYQEVMKQCVAVLPLVS
jgi:GTPase SAR1 family protein